MIAGKLYYFPYGTVFWYFTEQPVSNFSYNISQGRYLNFVENKVLGAIVLGLDKSVFEGEIETIRMVVFAREKFGSVNLDPVLWNGNVGFIRQSDWSMIECEM